MLAAAENITPPEEFICPITGKVMLDPVTTKLGHCYEKTAIEKWTRIKPTCPMTNMTIREADGSVLLVPGLLPKKLIRKWLEENPAYNKDEQVNPPMPLPMVSEAIENFRGLFATYSRQLHSAQQSVVDQTWGRISEAFRLLMERLLTEQNAEEKQANVIELTLLVIGKNAQPFLIQCLQQFSAILTPRAEQLWACALNSGSLKTHKILLDHNLVMQDKNGYLILLLAQNDHSLKAEILELLLHSYGAEEMISAQAIQMTVDKKDGEFLTRLLQTRRFQAPENLYSNLLQEYQQAYEPLHDELVALKQRFNGNDFSFYIALKLVDALAEVYNIFLCLLPWLCLAGGITLLVYDTLPILGFVMVALGVLSGGIQLMVGCCDGDDAGDYFNCIHTKNIVTTDKAVDARRMHQIKVAIAQQTSPVMEICKLLAEAGVVATQENRELAELHHFPENLKYFLKEPANHTLVSNTMHGLSSIADKAFLFIFGSSNSQNIQQAGSNSTYEMMRRV